MRLQANFTHLLPRWMGMSLPVPLAFVILPDTGRFLLYFAPTFTCAMFVWSLVLSLGISFHSGLSDGQGLLGRAWRQAVHARLCFSAPSFFFAMGGPLAFLVLPEMWLGVFFLGLVVYIQKAAGFWFLDFRGAGSGQDLNPIPSFFMISMAYGLCLALILVLFSYISLGLAQYRERKRFSLRIAASQRVKTDTRAANGGILPIAPCHGGKKRA